MSDAQDENELRAWATAYPEEHVRRLLALLTAHMNAQHPGFKRQYADIMKEALKDGPEAVCALLALSVSLSVSCFQAIDKLVRQQATREGRSYDGFVPEIWHPWVADVNKALAEAAHDEQG